MRFKRFVLPMLAAMIFGLITVSCSKERDVFDAIPSTVKCAGSIKLKTVFEDAGFKFADGSVISAPDADLPETIGRYAELIGRLDNAGVCDMNNMVWAVGERPDEVFLTLLVSDSRAFQDVTTDIVEWGDEVDGYVFGQFDGSGVLLGDDRVWLLGESTADDAVESVGRIMAAADESPLSAVEGVAQALRGDNVLNMVARADLALANGKDKKKSGGKAAADDNATDASWAVFAGNIKDNKIVGSGSMIKSSGEVVSLKGLKYIDTKVLSYAPENTNIAFGMAVTPDFDWSLLTDAVRASGQFQAQAMMSTAIPYLKSIDGTVFFAAGAANEQAFQDSDFDLGNWQFLLMVRLPENKINDLMGMVRSSMFMAGVSPKVGADGVMIVPQYGADFYIGNVDGYFAVSNMPFDSSRSNSLMPIFNGNSGALAVDISSLGVIDSSLPEFGVNFNLKINAEKSEVEIVLNNTQLPILQAILEASI